MKIFHFARMRSTIPRQNTRFGEDSGFQGPSCFCILFFVCLMVPSIVQALTFEEWRDSHFDPYSDYYERQDMLISGPNADPDADGITNLMEFALGLDPKVVSSPAGDVTTVVESGALTLSYPRWKNVGELSYVPQVSADLLAWSDGSTFIDTISITDHGTWELLKVRDKVALSTSPRRFMRLKITSAFIDTDTDGLPDWWEKNFFYDLSQGPTDDNDYDGLLNSEEFPSDTNPQSWDTDGDGISDGDEVHLYHTSPTKIDTDGDGMPDNWEIYYGFNPLDSRDAQTDFDNDGLSNVEEFRHDLYPNDPDYDKDGLPDGWEVLHQTDPKNGADANLDPDHDGLTNAEEYAAKSDPRLIDTDGDGLTDYQEVKTYHTKPDKTDSDSDGLPDKWEVLHGTDALVYDSNLDPDSDGLNNFQEWQFGTNPQNSDTDEDGLGDGAEMNTNRLLGDSDGDLLPDGLELFIGTNPLGDNSADDPDGDGMGRSLEHLAGRSSSVADSSVDTSGRALDVHTALEP